MRPFFSLSLSLSLSPPFVLLCLYCLAVIFKRGCRREAGRERWAGREGGRERRERRAGREGGGVSKVLIEL